MLTTVLSYVTYSVISSKLLHHGLPALTGVADGTFVARITSPDKGEIAVNASSQLVFNCSVTSGGPVKFFLWEKDGKVVQSKSGVALAWSALVKSSVNQSDAGMYKCMVGNGRENQTDVLTLHINCE